MRAGATLLGWALGTLLSAAAAVPALGAEEERPASRTEWGLGVGF